MTIQSETIPTSAIITVGIREFKNHLSTYLRQVKEGKTIVITDYGREIAQLMPRKMSVRDKLLSMRDAGLVEWNGEKFEPGEPVGETIGEKTLADLVIEMRE